MNPKLHSYKFNPAENVFERRVEFTIPNKPHLVSVTILRRSTSGLLLRSKRAEWRTIPLTPKAIIDTMQ